MVCPDLKSALGPFVLTQVFHSDLLPDEYDGSGSSHGHCSCFPCGRRENCGLGLHNEAVRGAGQKNQKAFLANQMLKSN